jgi:hypothetical protein
MSWFKKAKAYIFGSVSRPPWHRVSDFYHTNKSHAQAGPGKARQVPRLLSASSLASRTCPTIHTQQAQAALLWQTCTMQAGRSVAPLATRLQQGVDRPRWWCLGRLSSRTRGTAHPAVCRCGIDRRTASTLISGQLCGACWSRAFLLIFMASDRQHTHARPHAGHMFAVCACAGMLQRIWVRGFRTGPAAGG